MKQITKFIACTLSVIAVFAIACKKEKNNTTTSEENKPPIANAGADQVITLPVDVIILDGSGSSDPDNDLIGYTWSKVSGPAFFRFANAYTAKTQVSELEQGTYQFELKVVDPGGLSSRDTVQVTVLPAPLTNDSLSIINGSALLTHIGSLSEAKDVVPATAGDKVVFAGGYIEKQTVSYFPTANVDIYQLSTNTWSKATLSETRSGIATVTVGKSILYAGGHGNYNLSSRVDVYNAETSTWSTAELSIARNGIVTAVAGNKAFFAGGWASTGITSRVDIYDAATNTWSTAELSDKRIGFSAIALGNKVFFAGGYRNYSWDDAPIDFSTRVDIYDMATNQWSTAELSEASYGMTAAAVADKVFFAGGYTSSNPDVPSNRIDIYDAATNTWSTTTLSELRTSIKAVTVGNKVLFAGGVKGSAVSSQVDIYDASSNRWSTALLSQSRVVSSTAILGNKVLFFTGGHPNTNQIDIYDASAGTWSTAAFSKRIYSFAIAAGNQVYFGGGRIDTLGTNKLTSGVWRLQF